jgi:rare lipoprotein A
MGGLRIPLVLSIGLMLIYDGYTFAARSSPGRDFIQTGIASWYGREEQGKMTASGERFDRHDFTAASRRLPMNSVVRVTNEGNGRSVEVRINDRGPFVHGRILDLSEAAANTLDMKTSGTAPVKVELLSAPKPVAP